MAVPILGQIVAGILTALPFGKKPPYCLFVWDGSKWDNKNELGHSARRCKKARAEWVKFGVDPAWTLILPKGIEPPASAPARKTI